MDAAELELIDEVGKYATDPLGFVLFAFPWGEPGTQLEHVKGPRAWQAGVLRELGERLQASRDGYVPGQAIAPVRKAISSGNGIGKSALIAFVAAWALSTCPKTKLRVTANTADQLQSTTWAELGKWFGLLINKHWFDVQATSIRAVGYEREWFGEAKTWSKNNLVAFAGLHNYRSRVAMIFDEASGIDSGVWEFAEPVLTDADTEILWLALGNPTQTGNRFHRCFGADRHLWEPQTIDARTVEGTSKAQHDEWINSYGEDSDYVRVHVKGQFPRASSMQFIDGETAENACKREADASIYDACVIGVDVARFGDDESVIAIRKGRDARTIQWKSFRGVDTMQLAAAVAQLAMQLNADAVFVDGGGVGGGVVDRLRQLRVQVFDVQFGGKADRADFSAEAVKYKNKRAEMWGWMREWLKGGAIPDNQRMRDDLTGVQYGFDADNAIQLERKEDMKKRGLASPDYADALALTFAAPVLPSRHAGGPHGMGGPRVVHEYDPFA